MLHANGSDDSNTSNEPTFDDVQRLYQHAPSFGPREFARLVNTLVGGSAESRMSDDELVRLLDWAQSSLANYAMLEMVLEGKIQAHWPADGELTLARAQ